MKYNTLVIYEGGGYDGCIWELNAFLATLQNNTITDFANVGASGKAGIRTLENAAKLLSDKPANKFSWKSKQGYFHETNCTIYDLESESSLAEFANDYIADFVVNVCHKVNELLEESILYFTCDHCGEKVYSGTLEGYAGQGGTVVAAEEKYCEECYCSLSCGYCGEFQADGKHLNNDGCCYCHPQDEEEEESTIEAYCNPNQIDLFV